MSKFAKLILIHYSEYERLKGAEQRVQELTGELKKIRGASEKDITAATSASNLEGEGFGDPTPGASVAPAKIAAEKPGPPEATITVQSKIEEYPELTKQSSSWSKKIKNSSCLGVEIEEEDGHAAGSSNSKAAVGKMSGGSKSDLPWYYLGSADSD
jgi:hypothetical protein